MGTQTETAICPICGKSYALTGMRLVSATTPGTQEAIRSLSPSIPPDVHVCLEDVARMRRIYLESMLERERGALTALDHAVLHSLEAGTPLSAEPDGLLDDKRTFGERAADAVARFGGSWTFIFAFLLVILTWVGLNAAGALAGPFDPYPFILLNLVLSCVAALQAPVIMMSQRRQEAKDRLRSESDYKINLKAELEIRHLHEKLDLHLNRQWERLAAIQRLQVELLEETARTAP
jgi:uncharacterized membrane protein